MSSAIIKMTNFAGKFRGCLAGSLMGDCLGYPFENESCVAASNTKLTEFFNSVPVSTTRSGQPKIYPYTDDTAMTWCIAKSLIANKALDPVDLAKRFTAEYYADSDRCYGTHVPLVFMSLKSANFADPFQPAKDQFNGSGSYGNGGAMRVSPIALFCAKNETDMIKMVVDCSKVTHYHKDGYNGAVLQCFAIHQALLSDPSIPIDPIEFVDKLISKMEPIEKSHKCVSGDPTPFCAKLQTMKKLFQGGNKDLSAKEIAEILGNYVTALTAVPAAIYSFLLCQEPIESYQTDNPFVRTLYYSISLGGDTDTIGSMAGSIAGAFYGMSFIPEVLHKKCEKYEKSLELADQMLETVINM